MRKSGRLKSREQSVVRGVSSGKPLDGRHDEAHREREKVNKLFVKGPAQSHS